MTADEPQDADRMNTLTDEFSWLARWYQSQCDGDWEHTYGIQIETLDNPGWSVSIDLFETPLDEVPFAPVSSGELGGDGNPSTRWHFCRVREARFDASGGPLDLGDIIAVFRKWAESSQESAGAE